MTKEYIVQQVAEELGVSRPEADKAFKAVIGAIHNGVAGLGESQKFNVPGLGFFKVKTTPSRTGRHPRTGEAIEIASKRRPAFTVGQALKDVITQE